MFSHIMLGASDIEASKQFYDAALGALGYGPGVMDPKGRVFYMTETGILPSRRQLMAILQLQVTAAQLGLHPPASRRLKPGTRQGSQTAARLARIHPVCATGIWGQFTLLTSGIHRATRFARC